MPNHSDRFTDTVENYLRYRPSYPKDIIELAIKECHLTAKDVIADIGSGTGFLAKLFLDQGNTVIGVEPNDAMRNAAAHYLKSYPHFSQINATAEQTTLADHSVDLITVGTAFHWFDPTLTKIEFQRILKPKKFVFLIWNVRDQEHSALVNDYEQLILKYGKDYKNSRAQEFDKTVAKEFFTPNTMHSATFAYKQTLDWPGLKGRLLSASYSLREGDQGYEDMLKALKQIFDKHQHHQLVEFLYQTKVYYGQIHP